MVYEYDFGDGWEHEVVLESSEVGTGREPEVRVVAGKGACPPEDVGGDRRLLPVPGSHRRPEKP